MIKDMLFEELIFDNLINCHFQNLNEGFIKDSVEHIKNWNDNKIKQFCVKSLEKIKNLKEKHQRILKENGINFKDQNIQKDVLTIVSKRKSEIKRIIKNKDYKKIPIIIKDLSIDIKNYTSSIKRKIFDMKEKTTSEVMMNILQSFVLLFIVANINGVFMMFISMMFIVGGGSSLMATGVVTAIVAIFVAPVVEEIGKYI